MTGKQFKDIRLALGLSQKDLAEKMGRTKAAVSLWEAGLVPVPQYAKIIIETLKK